MRIAIAPTITTVAALLLASAGVLSGCNESSGAPRSQMPPPQVSTAAVVLRPITEWNDFNGRLEAVNSVEVRPRVGGQVVALRFKEGALVHRGDTLFLIDPRSYQAEVDRLKADLANADAKLLLARSEVDRARRLKEQNAIAVEEVDQRAEALQSADAARQGIAAQLATANLNLEFTRVTAPIDGRVGRAMVTEGNLVVSGPTGATLLTTVVSTDRVYAYFDADEQTYLKYAEAARAGSLPSTHTARLPVKLGLLGETGYPHAGTLDFLDNQLNAATGTIRMRAVFDNPKGELTPGLFARIQLPASTPHDGVLINDRAVGTDQGRKFVFVVDAQNTVHYRAVELGPLVDGLRVVRSGLHEGDVIVVNGLQRVRPGIQVAPAKVAMNDPSALDRPSTEEVGPAPQAAAQGRKIPASDLPERKSALAKES
jgi:multidrug efflux system membrane fusion protein